SFLASHFIVGQPPERQQAVDDKFATNALLHAAGLPVARSLMVAQEESADAIALSALSPAVLGEQGLAFPLVVKPVRGRGRPAGSGTKVATSLRLDRDLLQAFKDTGDGWQTRLNDALREWAKDHRMVPG
ncbi:BrnA antitoxin family protein, partial [Xanthomonas campestris]|uniref:BrnA antitoxin family protein n=1 Tax=Xanthomonas campestris TaxID=339 RepID=UPI002AD322C4